MPFFVAPLKNLSFMLNSKTKVEAEVTFRDVDGDRPLGKVVVPESSFIAVAAPTQASRAQGQGFAAKYTWTAAGLPQGKREMDVLMEHNKQAAGAKPTPIKVFNDTLRVRVTQSGPEGGGPVPAPRVDVKLTITADPGWLEYTRKPAPPPRIETTDRDGVAVFAGLAYGTYKAEVVTLGMAHDGEVVETADGWTIKVKPHKIAELVSPLPLAADAAPHKQWVNCDAVASRELNDPDVGTGETYGSLVKVKVKLKDEATAGQMVWLAVLFPTTNTKRWAPPHPGLNGTKATRGQLLRMQKTTDAQGIATFDLELGAAGGDEVKVFAAGHKDVSETIHDATTKLITWRRIDVVPSMLTCPDDAEKTRKLAESNAAGLLGQDVRTLVHDELLRAFVDLRWKDPREQPVAAKDVEFMSGETATLLKLDARTRELTVWTNANPPDKELKVNLPSRVFSPPRLFFFVFDKMVYRRPAARFSFSLPAAPTEKEQTDDPALQKKVSNIKASIPIPTTAGFFLSRDWDAGRKVILPWADGQPSYWTQDKGTTKVDIDDSYLAIVADTSNLTANLKVPKDKRTSGAAQIFLNVQTYGSLVGSASGKKIAITTSPSVTETPERRKFRLAYVILHELGHAMSLSVANPGASGLVDLPAEAGHDDNKNHFIRALNDGDHCSAGMSESDRNKAPKPWDDPKPTLSSQCVLYTPVHATTPYQDVCKYCETCLAHLRASSLGITSTQGMKSKSAQLYSDLHANVVNGTTY
jgi:hypothetical protein